MADVRSARAPKTPGGGPRLPRLHVPPASPGWLPVLATLFSIVAPAAGAMWAVGLLGGWLPSDFPARGPITVGISILVALGVAALAEDVWRVLHLPGGTPVHFLPIRWVRDWAAARQVRRLVHELTEGAPKPGDEALAQLQQLARALARRDVYTRAHSGRVSRTAMQMAERLGLTPEECETVRLAGLFHDIGKLEIPPEILNKPSALDLSEVRVLRNHPILGADLIRPWVAGAVLDAVRHHHERVDGRGYPDGVGHGSLSMVSRLITVVDTYDALTSDRPYRPGRGRGEAFEELRRASGTQLDPRLVELLVDVEGSKPSFAAAAAFLLPLGTAARKLRHAINTSAVPVSSGVAALAVAGAVSMGVVSTPPPILTEPPPAALRPPIHAAAPSAPPVVVDVVPPASEPGPEPEPEPAVTPTEEAAAPPPAQAPPVTAPPAPVLADRVAPVTTLTLDPPAPNGRNGWYRTEVSVCMAAADDASGVARSMFRLGGAEPRAYAGCWQVDADGAEHVLQYWSEDRAGNAEAPREVRFRIDRTAPSVAVSGCPATVLLGGKASATVAASDGLSGLQSQSVPNGVVVLDTSSVGLRTMTVGATDAAGNEATTSCSWRVVYDFTGASGFQTPVSDPPAMNVAHAPKAVPIKWRIPDGKGGFLRDLAVVSAVEIQQVSCDDPTSAVGPRVSAMASGGSTLRYDTGGDHYAFTWKTDASMAGSCYAFILSLNDGTEHTAWFRFEVP